MAELLQTNPNMCLLKTSDLSYFKNKNYFEGNEGAQNALVFQTMQKYFNLSNMNQISKWRSKGLSNQYVDTLRTLGDVLLSKPIKPMHVIFKGKGTLVQNDNDIVARGLIVNTYIVYKTSPKTINSNLFGAVKITNTIDPDTDKWKYSGYGIGFDSSISLAHPNDRKDAKNVIVSGADMSNSRHSTNKAQSVIVLCLGLIQKINDATIDAGKMYSPNFTVDNKTFCLILHYNSDNSYLFVNGKEFTKFNAKHSELIKYPICFGGLSKNYDTNSRKDTRLYGNIYDFSVDYNAIKIDKIVDIECWGLLKKCLFEQ